ncbi:O-antigen ligase family protein [Pseudoxanthomonas broegbernensis]|uniref:O-antigen ligase family protein n=1 Tax=Pseudoxanthomonas broegbernensis TaxID=83619 RepID=UPI00160A8339|nr:O-antigen ligase family protein [Pseudoxanthomonas broegbernensis]MBB6066125.1 O-antigen ligase [Pseudoxanthomonas broegbernensis]
MNDRGETRLRWAQAGASAALWCLPALVLTLPKGVLPFGLLLLASTLLVPGRLLAGARQIGRPLALAAFAGLFALGVAFASSWTLSAAPGQVDSMDRLLGLPWVMAWAYVLGPSRGQLWRGALFGLVAAAVLAGYQVLAGAERASGWGNAIVFADVVLALMVLVVFCRPPRRWRWATVGLACGTVAILLSGTRGAWPGLLLVLVVLVLGSGWQSRRSRILLLGAAVAVVAALVGTVPGLTERMRLSELQQDIVRIDRGDHDSSAGARLERLQVAARAFAAQPWSGVGFAHFDRAMRQRLSDCRRLAPALRCDLGHAHNDLAEWAATMGVPGVAALACLYGIPLWLFLRLRRSAVADPLRGAAAAGAMVVAVYVLCGLTQSMFAHQTTTSLYAALTGILLGLALREARVAAPS